MVTWKSAQLGVKLVPAAARRRSSPTASSSSGADLRLVRRADGSANWQGIGRRPASRSQRRSPRELNIDGLEIEDSRLSFVDEGVPRRIEITASQSDYGRDRAGRTVHRHRRSPACCTWTASRAEGVPFRLEVPKAVAARRLSRRRRAANSPSRSAASRPRAAFAAHSANSPKLAGEIETNHFDLRALLTAVGIDAPKTTDPKALGKIALRRHLGLRRRRDRASIRFRFDARRHAFHRQLSAATAGEDRARRILAARRLLDIARYIPPTDPASEPFVLPTAALKALRFRGVLELEQATLDDIDMKGVTLRLLLDEQGLRSVRRPPEETP